MMIGYPVEPSPEIVEEVTCMLRKGGIQAVRDAEQYVLKSGAGTRYSHRCIPAVCPGDRFPYDNHP
jgi:hypothetical protein